MAHTYSNLMVHGVFSTRRRQSLLSPRIMPELVRIIGGIIRERDGKLLALNGPADHVHVLAVFHPKRSVSDMFRDIKAISCDWIHGKFPFLRDFAWQEGYSVFSVSRSNAGSVEQYIARQVQHHARRSFEEELIALLDKHGIEYDRRYVCD